MVVIEIETAIRRVSWATAQVGRKSLQRIEVDFAAGRVTQSVATGTTSLLVFEFGSIRDDFRIIKPRFSGGKGFFTAKGQTASAVGFMPNIDYRLNFEVDAGSVKFDGAHDGYPSYNVAIGGRSVYDHVQGHLGELLGDSDVTVRPRTVTI